jgi:hypothetical protein
MRMRFAAFVVAAALAAPGCASTQDGAAPEAAPPAGEPPAAPDATAPAPPGSPSSAPSALQPELGRTLQSLDKRVDEYYALAGKAGDEARGRRTVLGSAIEADVQKHQDALLAMAADPQEDVRRRIAVKALAFSRDARTMPALVKILQSRSDPHVLTSAAYGVARIADPNTPLPPLPTRRSTRTATSATTRSSRCGTCSTRARRPAPRRCPATCASARSRRSSPPSSTSTTRSSAATRPPRWGPSATAAASIRS